MIERGSPIEARLIQLLKQQYSKERGGVHVSDLTLCIREQVFRKLDPKPLSDLDLSYFALGTGSHLALQRLADIGKIESERHLEYKGVTGSVDLFEEIPIEVKTSRSQRLLTEPKSFWIKQLSYYMAMIGSNVGIIFVFNMMNFNQPFISWTITLSNSEIKSLLDEIEKKATNFSTALSSKDPFMANHVKNDPDLRWKCDRCAWEKPCWSKRELK